MSKKNLIIVGVLVVIVVGAGAYWLLRKGGTATVTNDTSDRSLGTTSTEPAVATITYSASGFSPSSVTVKSGDTVAIKNASSQSMQFDSDPHPIHTSDPELNVGDVPAGETLTFKVETKGSFGYHNHLNPAQKGALVVE